MSGPHTGMSLQEFLGPQCEMFGTAGPAAALVVEAARAVVGVVNPELSRYMSEFTHAAFGGRALQAEPAPAIAPNPAYVRNEPRRAPGG